MLIKKQRYSVNMTHKRTWPEQCPHHLSIWRGPGPVFEDLKEQFAKTYSKFELVLYIVPVYF